ncbi:MAG: imidazole glycerol phosphate synthase subunit HisH [Proteobacteria bacterium]|nr:imidazole glycerol phosphate synthase subunit HisH [Pseudomonadota bacterium]
MSVVITIVDLGMGNLHSVKNALSNVAPGQTAVVTADPQQILDAERVVLPGQGAIGTWFRAYERLNLSAAINDAINNKPLLGICIGQQAMFQSSDEDGGVNGFGLFDGKVRHFSEFHKPDRQTSVQPRGKLKIPHMGWNQVSQTQPHPLWDGIADQTRFYFVHSYCANAENPADVFGVTDYGHKFTAAVGRQNVFAVQFHPEKSQHAGLQLLRNFTEWDGSVQ